MLKVANKDERIAVEIAEAFDRAKKQSIDCDSILILMQRKEGGLIYEAIPSMRLETISYLATSFLHGFHQSNRN